MIIFGKTNHQGFTGEISPESLVIQANSEAEEKV